MIFLVVSLRGVAPNMSEQRLRSGLCKRVIRREATETEGLVSYISPSLRKVVSELRVSKDGSFPFTSVISAYVDSDVQGPSLGSGVAAQNIPPLEYTRG